MAIPKKASDRDRFRLPFHWFPRGRDAFEHVLSHEVPGRKPVLLPAYIGWGRAEGSGVFDPVRRSGRKPVFYRLDRRLRIDVASVRRAIEANPGAVLLLVHYFGFVDPAAARVRKLAATHGCPVVDDFAHGLFTFLRDPVVDFDFGVFSLHKMLPYRNRTGGLLVSRKPLDLPEYEGFHRYNLALIARRRRENYEAALDAMRRVKPRGVEVLRSELGDAVPESFPILLTDRAARDEVHRRMNARGFGLISLYHALIAEVGPEFRAEREVSDRITNLPVHQDAEPREVTRMVEALGSIARELA